MQHSTRHTADTLRFLLAGPVGLLEMRMTLDFNVLVFHTQGCNGEGCGYDCDAEATHGDEIAFMWSAGDQNDRIVTGYLEAHYDVWRASSAPARPEPPHEPTADERGLIARLRNTGEEMGAEGYFDL